MANEQRLLTGAIYMAVARVSGNPTEQAIADMTAAIIADFAAAGVTIAKVSILKDCGTGFDLYAVLDDQPV